MISNIPVEIIIDVVGEVTGETYKGVFRIHPILSHRALLKKDQIRRDLLGSQGGSPAFSAGNTAEVFSTIWAHLANEPKAAPSFWVDSDNGLDLLDEAPMVALWEAIVKLESDTRAKVAKKAQEAVKDLKEIK